VPAIALLSQKGGAGKTTLAVCCGDGLIIDTDKQKSAAGWWREREGKRPELVTSEAQSVSKAREAKERVGVYPRHEEALCAVCAISDFILFDTHLGRIRPAQTLAGCPGSHMSAGRSSRLTIDRRREFFTIRNVANSRVKCSTSLVKIEKCHFFRFRSASKSGGAFQSERKKGDSQCLSGGSTIYITTQIKK
jgi:hypothetical protein